MKTEDVFFLCSFSGMGRHNQPSHSKRGGVERPGRCQTTRQHPQDKRASVQGSWTSVCCAGTELFDVTKNYAKWAKVYLFKNL
jgi:hypothetical protein